MINIEVKTQTSQNKQLEQEKQNDSVVKQGTASKSSDEMYHQ